MSPQAPARQQRLARRQHGLLPSAATRQLEHDFAEPCAPAIIVDSATKQHRNRQVVCSLQSLHHHAGFAEPIAFQPDARRHHQHPVAAGSLQPGPGIALDDDTTDRVGDQPRALRRPGFRYHHHLAHKAIRRRRDKGSQRFRQRDFLAVCGDDDTDHEKSGPTGTVTFFKGPHIMHHRPT